MSQTLGIKKEYLSYSFMVWFGLIVAYISSQIISSSYNGNIDEANKIAQDILLNPAMAQPEPKEKAIFLGSIIITVLGLLLGYFLINRFFKKSDIDIKDSSIHFVTIVNALIVFYLLYKCFGSANPFFSSPQNSHDVVSKTNFDFYFIQTFLHKRLLIYLLFLIPILAFVLIKNFKLSEQLHSLLKKIVLGTCIGLSTLAFAISTFEFPYTFENKYDFNAIFYSVVQVYNGFPLLVDDFTNTYGMYPHFLVPILKLTGLSVLNFSIIMGALLCTCFILLYYTLTKTINNKFIVLLGFCSVFFMCYGYQKIAVNYDAIYSTHPIRWILPMLLFAFTVFYMINKDNSNHFLFKSFGLKNIVTLTPIKILSFIVFAFGILWNPDFGTFSFLTLIALYTFIDLDINQIKVSIIKILFTVIEAIIILFVAFFLYSTFIKIAYQASPDISILFKTIATFSSIGFGMLPMPTTLHPWMLVALVYIVGWVVSIQNLFNNQKNAFTLVIFVLTFIGTIGLTYYQGRSHNWNLFVTNFEAFIILALFADRLLEKAKNYTAFVPVFALALLFIGFSPFQLIGSFSKFQELISSKKDKATNQMEDNAIKGTSKKIDDICKDGESIFILSADHYQGLYHLLSKTTSCANPGFIDLFTKKQYEHILNEVKNNNDKLFLEPQYYRPMNTQLLNVIGAYYQLQQINDFPSLYYYKKKEFTKYQPKLTKDANTIFYVNTNLNGNENLRLYGGTVKPVNLGKSFSIDIIFTPPSNPITNINTGGTILSNLDNNKGFVIQQQQQNLNQYLFAYKGRGIICNVELNKSVKMTFKVEGMNLSCYLNDVLQSQAKLTEAYENSSLPLCLGSINNKSNFFLGNIDEVKITHTTK